MKKYLSPFGILALMFVLSFGFNFSPVHATAGEDANDTEEMEMGGSMSGRPGDLKPLIRVNREGKGMDGEHMREGFRLGMENKGPLLNDKIQLLLEFKQKREEAKQKMDALRGEAKDKFEALKESLKGEKDETKAKMQELRLELREKALMGFDNITNRLAEFSDKISGTIEKLNAKGVDTDDATDYVKTADSKLDEAKTKITEVNTLLGTSLNELTEGDKAKLKALKSEIQPLLQEAHESLKKAVETLKITVKAKIEDSKTKEEDKDKTEDKAETETAPN